ncbi:Ribonuclease III domain family protein [Clavispora lusitaniae]|uniref:ribonuclease III n=1 Tax=Clavispora lusitaniae TaxID=36911 RepID=A0AA91T3V5_CLALS|nr:Ribonuclease III domain family protein [Clavispora lusitaniae]OVF10666.1 putative ribonuclease III [Clavispora lusitaniae]
MSDLKNFLNTLTKAATQPSEALPAPNARKKMKTSEDSSLETSVFGYTDINKFEHCARSLQKNVRIIVEEAPDSSKLEEYAQDNSVDKFARQEIQSNGLLHLVAKLKTLYEDNQMQIFDDILENKITIGSKRTRSQISTGDTETDDQDFTSKVLSEDDELVAKDSSLPPLPKIRNAHLRARVFQHKSTSANKTYLAEQEIVSSHNERLEFLGDSVLNTLVTFILYEKFPFANEGLLSQIRSSLVSNKTLAEFSTQYGFDQSLRCKVDESALRNGKQKIFADIFEAYVGALAMERGFDMNEVQQWLKTLMASKLSEADLAIKKATPINKDAKTELYSLVGTASLHPIYKVVQNGNGVQSLFKVQCVMEDNVLGEGVAPGLRDAGLRAAMAALKNKPMLEKYGRRRLETDRSISVVSGEAGESKSDAPETNTAEFPLIAGSHVFANKFAKNEAYAFFGRTLGLTPEYAVSFDAENNRYKAELKVKEKVVSVAYDASKKNAMSRAATVLLENKEKLNALLNYI